MEVENTSLIMPLGLLDNRISLDNCTVNASDYHRSTFFNIAGSLFTFVVASTAILGNSAVVIASFWDEALRVQIGNILIVYLAFTDIMTGFIVMLPSGIAVAADHWPLGWVLCKANAVFNYMFACSSSFNIALISLDRAIAVTFPLKYQTIITKKVMFGFCSWILFLSSIVGLELGAPYWSNYDYTEGVCAVDYTLNMGVFYTFTSAFCCCYVLPACIIGVCNALIIFTARKSGKNQVQPLFVRRGQSDSQMSKTIKSMVVVVVTYYICFSPYALSKQTKVFLGMEMPPQVNYIATICIFIASATNPFIYAILRKDFREAFKRIPRMLVEKCFCNLTF